MYKCPHEDYGVWNLEECLIGAILDKTQECGEQVALRSRGDSRLSQALNSPSVDFTGPNAP